MDNSSKARKEAAGPIREWCRHGDQFDLLSSHVENPRRLTEENEGFV